MLENELVGKYIKVSCHIFNFIYYFYVTANTELYISGKCYYIIEDDDYIEVTRCDDFTLPLTDKDVIEEMTEEEYKSEIKRVIDKLI